MSAQACSARDATGSWVKLCDPSGALPELECLPLGQLPRLRKCGLVAVATEDLRRFRNVPAIIEKKDA